MRVRYVLFTRHTPDTHLLFLTHTDTDLHYPVEGEALQHREHEHRAEEHDVRFADREPRFTTPSS